MQSLRRLLQADNVLAAIALVGMALIPLVEILSRPVMGKGIENAPVVVQHLGLVMAMCGAIAAERFGHLTSLGVLWPRFYALGQFISAMVCGVLAWASAQLVLSEMSAQQVLAYGVPVWCVQLAMPIGFSLLGMKLGARCSERISMQTLCAVLAPASGALVAFAFDGQALPLLPSFLMLLLMAVFGAPIFAVLGGLALALLRPADPAPGAPGRGALRHRRPAAALGAPVRAHDGRAGRLRVARVHRPHRA